MSINERGHEMQHPTPGTDAEAMLQQRQGQNLSGDDPRVIFDFASLVFDEDAMAQYLSPEVHLRLKEAGEKGLELSEDLADAVAAGMKQWALDRGATHYTHWFQPMNGVTAEKHDAFLQRGKDGKLHCAFHGAELIKGEPDASSFPSGDLRSIFEARGYTAWDPSSYAFLKDQSLTIPTAFCSYSGHAMDKKTPLLRSMEALNRQALRILRLFGDEETRRVEASVGIEQEYFLVDENLYRQRPDLVNCSRTLFGARPAKGQELNDHYFGSLKPRVQAFMHELDQELWKLGVPAKTKHNEVAPSQHELAPIFARCNVACDQNQLTMETMKKVAHRHQLVCLLHEKPYAGLNGSGKHNNWSLVTDQGINLLDPGDEPQDNLLFLLLLTAVISGVDMYQGLLRISTASASNDHRLGQLEAPPAILSIYLGSQLTEILERILEVEPEDFYTQKPLLTPHESLEMEFGVRSLPRFKRDMTDRNRTSPFAFNGNRFEFRMLGSSDSAACANMMLNAIVADTLMRYAGRLEEPSEQSFEVAVLSLIRDEIRAHQRILFNGNAYSEAWQEEAQRRGLISWSKSYEALMHYHEPQYVELLARQEVLDEEELLMRQEVLLEKYNSTIQIEGFTMLHMVQRGFLPAALRTQRQLSETVLLTRQALGMDEFAADPGAEEPELRLLRRCRELTRAMDETQRALRQALREVSKAPDCFGEAEGYGTRVIPLMQKLREVVDAMEQLQDHDLYPYPSYQTLLYSESFPATGGPDSER